MSRGYKTESSILGKLQTLGTEKGKTIELPILRRFQESTGINFQQDIDEFLKVRDLLDSPTKLDAYKKGLKSYEWLAQEEVKRKALSDPRVTRKALEKVDSS